MRDGFGGQLLDALLRRFDAVQAGIGELAVLRVGPDGLAELSGVGGEVEQVVDQLEGDARGTAGPAAMFDVSGGGPADQRAHGERGAEHRGGLAEQDEFEAVVGRARGESAHVFGLSADEQRRARGHGEFAHERGGEGGAVGVADGEEFEGQRLQGVAGQQGRGFVEGLVAGRAAAS